MTQLGRDRLPRLLPVAPSSFDSRSSIEHYLDRLNRGSQIAQRRILGWSAGDGDRMSLSVVPRANEEDGAFMAEAQLSFGFDVCAQELAAASAPYTVGMLMSGSMRLTLDNGVCEIGPGDGVVVDPATIERSQFSAGSHFIEFSVPKASVTRLAQQLTPGDLVEPPRFSPRVAPQLAQRLLFIAAEAASALLQRGPESQPDFMFSRWSEMLALTLLNEQEHRSVRRAALAAEDAAAPEAVAVPKRLKRALDFIDAHAHRNIALADVAEAAHLSASTLLRLFTQHVGMTPGAFLRQVRLDRARAELCRGDIGSIRELAHRWGFLNAAKFSQAYERQFGELPRDTVRS